MIDLTEEEWEVFASAFIIGFNKGSVDLEKIFKEDDSELDWEGED